LKTGSAIAAEPVGCVRFLQPRKCWRIDMSITLIASIVATAAVVYFVRKRRAARKAAEPVFYACRQCEHPYAMPNVPLKCRRCGGPVDKTIEN